MQNFKVAAGYAKQALAILNHSPELLEDAKNGLAEAYYAAQAKERMEQGRPEKGVEKVPQVSAKARDEAGKAAGDFRAS